MPQPLEMTPSLYMYIICCQNENIKLDPELDEACRYDVDQYCSNISPGNAQVIECLKKNHKVLSEGCKKKIFKREVSLAAKEMGSVQRCYMFYICQDMFIFRSYIPVSSVSIPLSCPEVLCPPEAADLVIYSYSEYPYLYWPCQALCAVECSVFLIKAIQNILSKIGNCKHQWHPYISDDLQSLVSHA